MKRPRALLAMLFALVAAPALPAAPGDAFHLGVVTCSNSTCHGAATPLTGSMVTQHEFMVWRDHDKHSKAYQVLLSDRAKTIASNLGIPSPQTAPGCLACHSDNAPAALRGKNWRVEDGVGCETCHGGASNWLGVHANGNSHAENVAAGMYPTEDPSARAKLCLGCHLFKGGDDYQHKYYAAGHPRLKFELDTYTEERPGHHQIDEDYRRRKPGSYGARAWVLGQAGAARKLVGRLATTAGKDPWPDFSVFACYGCHRKPSGGEPNASGYPIFQDAAVQMTAVALDALGLDSGDVRKNLKRLTAAVAGSSVSEWKASASTLDDALARSETALRGRAETSEDATHLLQALLKHAANGEFHRQHVAEQATYAMATLRIASPQLSKLNADQANTALDHLFDAAGQTATFDPAAWDTAAAELGAALTSAGP